MREIKFRAWHKKGGYVKDFMVMGDGIIYEDWRDFEDSISSEDLTLEQFTGLRDKNGKEIYEGDILDHSDGFSHLGVVQFCMGLFGINWDYAKNQDPEWKDGQNYGGWGNEHNLRKMGDGFNREMVVIGNIHENGDLIK
jgi:uncharacterized phage protein (TIGR01671 family)